MSSLALAASVFAAPLIEERSTRYDATFDDIAALPAVAIQPVGDYKAINYNGFDLTTLGTLGIYTTGVKAHSNFNTAAYGVYSNLLQGTPQMMAIAGRFDLESFYFGCVVNTAASVLGVGTTCTVTISGTTWDKRTPTQSFTFTPKGLLPDMQYAQVVRQFKGLTDVTFSTSAPTSVLTASLFDDFVYTVYDN